MYKIIIPPALAILLTSIAIALLAKLDGNLTLMTYAWGMSAFSGLAFVALLCDYLMKGLHHFSELEKMRIEREEYERKEEVRQLYEDTSHSDEWKRGFAAAAGFLAENYLCGDKPGVTENAWFEMMKNTPNGLLSAEPGMMEDSYRCYMVAALLYRHGISMKEYDEIKEHLKGTTGGMILADTPYDKPTIDQCTEYFVHDEKKG